MIVPPDLSVLLLLGAVAGGIAALVMDVVQRFAVKPLGQDGGGDPATVKLADKVGRLLTGQPVTQKRRASAGMLVHYLTGIALGMLYVVVAADWPTITLWFGVAYGLVAMIALDEIAVPSLGLGPPPWRTPPATHLYSLVSHVAFGAALQAAREIGFLLF